MKIPFSYNWRNILARRLTTGITILGTGLVVFVFSAVLMLANGLRTTLVETGDYSNVIFLRKGANAEISSVITREQFNIIKSQSEVKLQDGRPMVAGEVVVLNNLPKRSDNEPSNVMVRGVGRESLAIRSKVNLIAGRMWQPGTSEIITGKGVAERFKGCGLGETVKMGGREWEVVGIFAAGGSGFESEIWGDVEQFMDAFDRPVFSSVTMRMDDPEKFMDFKSRIESEPRLTVDAKREPVFYEEQSASLGTFIKILGLTVTIIFSFGAMTGATITMYSAVANRSAEIGTLRALGFRRRNILFSFLVECILLSLLGGTVGLLFASMLQFIDISTTNWASFSELVFGFSLSPGIVAWSFVFSIIMGIAGGMAPAFRAARLKVVDALRA